jgi:hypothetical protein
MRITAVLILLFTLTAAPASACFTTAAQFRKWMNEYAKFSRGEEDSTPSSDAYMAYVSAVSDGLSMNDLVCVGAVTLGDVGDVVVRRFDDWMKANFALSSQTCAHEVVSSILVERFPCDPKPPAKTPAK